MIAIEVPTHNWKRTSFGTSSKRKTSYRTGTMSAPPPIPKSPARMPVMNPAIMIKVASSRSSLTGTPNTIVLLQSNEGRSSRGAVHHLRAHIHDERESFAERSHARGRFYCLGREVPAKGACAGNATE